jgi:oligopeptide transport system substrate-binding protein
VSKIPTVSAVLVTLVLALAGCHRGKAPKDAAGQQDLVRALGGEPETLDPRLAQDNPSLALAGDLYEGLVAEAPDGTLRPGAADEWAVDPSGKQWTFHLRPNLRWSDGRPLAAAEFAAGLDAARRPGTDSPYGELLKPVTRVTAASPGTVSIELDAPLPELPAILALPFASPLPASVGAGRPITNGPYRLVARRPGERVELERNPFFHDAVDVAIPRITYLTLEDLNSELNLYRTGGLDITSEVPNAQLDWLRQNLPAELHVVPYLSTYAYAINLQRLPDRHARQALAMAVDREQITRLVTGAGETPAFGWVPEGMPGYVPARFDWRTAPGSTREAQARSLWSAAGNGKTSRGSLVLCTDASANHHRTAVALADQWHRVLGVTIELREMEWKAYLATREQPGDCDLLRFGWSADYVDPGAFLTLFGTGSSQNVFHYSNPRYDELLTRANASADPQERLLGLAAAEAELLHDVPVIPVFHRVSKRLVKPYVHGVVGNPLGHLQSRYLSLQRK